MCVGKFFVWVGLVSVWCFGFGFLFRRCFGRCLMCALGAFQHSYA